MKSKIALILCIIMCFSALVSCKGADDTSADVSSEISSSSVAESEAEISQESSDDSSEPEPTPAIPENARYFQDEYYFPHFDGHILSNKEGLNEWHSYGITTKVELQSYKPDEYYYVGLCLKDDDTTDNEELKTKNERMLKQVGFIPTEEKYLNKDYVWDLLSMSETVPVEEHPALFLTYAQNLMPDVDLSLYSYPDGYGYGFLTDFAYDYTGYITLDGLKQLTDNYKSVVVTWLPAPDDRIRFLTYIKAKRVGQ